MTKCDNCGEAIDGPARANPNNPDENLCLYGYKQIKDRENR